MTSRLRRPLTIAALLLGFAASSVVVASAAESRVNMANGIKIGEVDQDSAIVWTRLTRDPERNKDGKPFEADDGRDGKGLENLDERQDSVPGTDGEVRVSWWEKGDKEQKHVIDWKKVEADKDYTIQFVLENLKPAAEYVLLVEGRADGSDDSPCQVEGNFRTAPPPDDPANVKFVVITGQVYQHRDDMENGHKIYPTMLKLDPDFFIHTGDIEYFDTPKPYATSLAAARFKWNRIYAMPFQREFHKHVASYFMKDDHDTLRDDCWPGQTYGDLTFAQGQQLFLDEVPMGEKTYRTVRWGKDLQIWLPEGRDFRSPNPDPDGPDKTIWGKEQKQWFFDTVKKSDATFRILICQTPMVGPDKKRKRDNHANPNFTYEGNELRKFLADENMIFICGDRHWQYVSVDPVSGLREFCCGPASNRHAGGLKKEEQTSQLQFLRVKGGFLEVEIDRQDGVPRATLRFRGVNGKVHHEEVFTAEEK